MDTDGITEIGSIEKRYRGFFESSSDIDYFSWNGFVCENESVVCVCSFCCD